MSVVSSLSVYIDLFLIRWLFACATAQMIVPAHEYLVRPHPPLDPVEDMEHAPISNDDVADEGEESLMMKSFRPNYDLQVKIL